MNQQEHTEQSIKILSTSALWYAWGQIDAKWHADGFETDHGQEFQRLYEALARAYSNEELTSRPNILDAWKRFVHIKLDRGLNDSLDPEDIVGY